MSRVAITGMGVVSPVGQSVPKFWDNIKKGNSGVRVPNEPLNFKTAKTTQIGRVEDFKLAPAFERRWVSKTEKHVQFALNATDEAVTMSGLDFKTFSEEQMARVHSVVGICGGDYDIVIRSQRRIDKGQPTGPGFISAHIPNMLSGWINMHYGITGGGLCVAGACAGGNQSVSVGCMLIETGQADVVIAGASDHWLQEVVVSGFESAGVMSFDEILPRPFDRDRSGLALAEGAGILVLESESHARKRGAEILSYLSGYCFSNDAYHPTSPDPSNKVLVRAIKTGLSKAGINAEDIDYINPHATGTVLGDVVESVGFAQVFGTRPPMSATKSITGHACGASSMFEAIIGIMAIREGVVPGTINLKNIDPECPGNHITETRDHPVKHVISNSYGFGGTNGLIVISQ